MGGVCSNSGQHTNARGPKDGGRVTDQKLQKDLDSDKKRDRAVNKLLLLGPGNSGKSTFLKQLSSIHNDGFSEANIEEAVRSVADSVLTQIKALITECRALQYDVSLFIFFYVYKKKNTYTEMINCNMFEIQYNPKGNCESKTLEAMRFIDDLPRNIEITDEIAKNVKVVWADPAIKETFKDRTNLSVVDSAPHFFESIDRIAEFGYRPTEQVNIRKSIFLLG
ncbi:protein ALEX GNASL [Reticulomyxa filosa]|uniref:Protein ALEX GNASL n=1 Tax=Reticulomyxa filosa TaxID=46433 RepID=X6N5G4_RETFI|nr:protein ALEX GNASL [Reticulomyxa filosa]|eukprot:ETO20979.1 protein ALEX GNASL [Reticulomyxa filosa]